LDLLILIEAVAAVKRDVGLMAESEDVREGKTAKEEVKDDSNAGVVE
jgi:hypothetical protein